MQRIVLKKQVALIIYSDDNYYEVCCYFVTAQVALAVNTPQRAVTKKPTMLKYVWFLFVFLHHLIDQK